MSELSMPDPGPSQNIPSTRTSSMSQGSPLVPRPARRRIPSRNSTTSFAESDTSEIHAPVPRHHHLLQRTEPWWLHTPEISPHTSRAVSPMEGNGTLGRRSRMLSFSALQEEPKNRKPEEDLHGWGRRWIRWMHRNSMRSWVAPVTMLGVAWVKWTVGLGGYSGYQSPPMYGDFEAQRHWLEITTHLPIRQWYTYDLPYWGLDYPPLTAYHSWICGKIGSWIDPSWFALDSSRGIEVPNNKLFMRTTVFTSDLLVYYPAVFLFVRRFLQHRSGRTKHVALLTLLLQPALILIDSGHFQYNSVMLGFTLLCLDYLAISLDTVGSVFFVLSLCFKQMALYYAPAIGSYLLGKCIFLGPRDGRKLFVRLASTTLLTFLLLFLPWLTPTAIMDPLSRIFPFNRGLFEDKVANFWCASDVVLKWRRWLSPTSLIRLSATFTVAGFSPAVLGLLYGAWSIAQKVRDSGGLKDNKTSLTFSPTFALLPYALLTSSLSFFLFSFQVHEKSILLPLLPATLILSGAESGGGGQDWEWGVLFNNVAVFSMWPLLKKDGQALQYVALTVLWNRAIGYNPFALKSGLAIRLLSLAAYIGIFGLHAAEAIIKPPTRYPDLFPVLNVLVSTPVFLLTWLWSIKRGIEVGWTLSGLPSAKGVKDRERPERIGKIESSSVRKRSVRLSSIGHGRGTM